MVGECSIFLYPGQGSQFPGMAKDLFQRYGSVKKLFQLAHDVLGRDMEKLLFKGSEEELKATENSQPAITLASLASREALREEGLFSTGAAGHSLGEYAALADAEVLGIEDTLMAVNARGRCMADAAARVNRDKGKTGMAAVLGLDTLRVREILADKEDVWPANENAPGQVVIAGTEKGMTLAEEALKEGGAKRLIPLKVAGPFHTPLMGEAAEKLKEVLSPMNFADPVKKVWSNVSAGLVLKGAQARDFLVQQITAPVLWEDLTRKMGEYSPKNILEVGPGRVLCGLWKRSGQGGTCFPAGNPADINAVKLPREKE